MKASSYQATYDKTAYWMTAGYVFVTVLSVLLWLFAMKGHSYIITLILTGIGLMVFLFSTKSYQLVAGGIVINRYIYNKLILNSTIREIKILQPEDIKGSQRVFGVGGLFGYYGKFLPPKLGDMTWYLTNRTHLIAVFLNDDSIILISPDDNERFYNDWITQTSGTLI
jgi:hypothetical protein